MGVLNPNSTSYVHPDEPNLLNIHKAMTYDEAGEPHLRVTLGSDNITITGDVNLVDTVSVNSTPEDPVHVHLTEVGTSGLLAVPYLPIGGAVTVTNTSFAITNFPTTSTVYQGTTPWVVTGTVNIGTMPEVEIKNDSGNPIPVSGTVTATITDVITVVVNEDAGDLYAFNNHATNANRGWTMDEVMRPVVSFQNGSASAADIIKIVEYEIGNNNANQSTIVYEWYEGPLTISGAAIPAWTTFGVHSQYRVYQDRYQSNTGNTFTVPTGTYQRHSGIIIGKNTSGDEGPANLRGGDSRNMLTLCMRRVDNATKLDVWFAFTVKELT